MHVFVHIFPIAIFTMGIELFDYGRKQEGKAIAKQKPAFRECKPKSTVRG